MELSDYLRILRRQWTLIAGATLVGILLGGLASVLLKPTYASETQLFVAIQSSGSVQELQQGNTFSQSRVQSYVKTVTTPAVLQPVIDELGLAITPAELAEKVKATSDLNTVLITISVENSSPVQAAAIARSTADSLVDTVDKLERPKAGGPSPVSMSVVTPAEVPNKPASPNVRLNLLFGLVVGLALGVALGLLRTTLDSKVRGEADLLEITSAPLLGGIAYDADASRKPLLTQAAPQSHRAESFRQLRTNLQFASVSGSAKSVLVTSSLPAEGKSTTATNLAIAIAQSGQSVCLVDADLRRPMVSEYLGLDRNAGLTTALLGAAEVHDLLQPWGEENLYVLASGQIPPNPSELLGSQGMKDILDELDASFDVIVIDAPPLLPVTDAAVLSQFVGGVVLVIGSQKVRRQDLAKSLGSLELVGAKLLGVVLNRLPTKGPDAYAYSYYGQDEGPQKGARKTYSRSGRKSSKPSAPARFQSEHEPTFVEANARPARAFPSDRFEAK